MAKVSYIPESKGVLKREIILFRMNHSDLAPDEIENEFLDSVERSIIILKARLWLREVIIKMLAIALAITLVVIVILAL